VVAVVAPAGGAEEDSGARVRRRMVEEAALVVPPELRRTATRMTVVAGSLVRGPAESKAISRPHVQGIVFTSN